MKGQQSLFSELFEHTETRISETPRPRNFYMPERNLHLAYRYYYYAEIKFIRYDKCLQILESEFYITESRIIDVLGELTDMLRTIIEAKPTIKELQQKIPHFNW